MVRAGTMYHASRTHKQKWTKGKYVPGTRTCLIGGTAAIVGGYLVGMGVPATIYAAGLTCFVEFIK